MSFGQRVHNDDDDDYTQQFVTSAYDPRTASSRPPMRLSLDGVDVSDDFSRDGRGDSKHDGEDDDDEDDEEDDEEDDPYTEEDQDVTEFYSKFGQRRIRSSGPEAQANEHFVFGDPSSNSGGRSTRGIDHSNSFPGRSGPLMTREVLALRKGVEEAVHLRDAASLREEQEEQAEAAEEERRFKLRFSSSSTTSVPVPGSGAGARRVKILILGDSGVGKSSLVIRWTADTFSTDLVGTVGVNFKNKRVLVEGEAVQAQVWDTAGQEQFHKITTSYYRGAQGIMLVYDVSDRKSVENIRYWVKNIRTHASDWVRVALIGNKVDLRDSSETGIDSSYGVGFSNKYGVPYFETSAKDNTNVDLAFQTLIRSIVQVPEQPYAAVPHSYAPNPTAGPGPSYGPGHARGHGHGHGSSSVHVERSDSLSRGGDENVDPGEAGGARGQSSSNQFPVALKSTKKSMKSQAEKCSIS